MHFRVIAVGKPRDRALAAAIADYEARAQRYWPLEVIELRDRPSLGRTPDIVRRVEGERILARLKARIVIACDEHGELMTSDAFARWLQALRERGADVEFVIGGASGLHDAVRDRAAKRLALAPWTLSHALARLVLAEQLYRAGTIVRGEPYHR